MRGSPSRSSQAQAQGLSWVSTEISLSGVSTEMSLSMKSREFEIIGAILTDIGRVRKTNEDAVAFVTPSKDDPAASRGFLILVADGMGGHAAGEVASALAIEVVQEVYYSLRDPI